MTEYLKFNQEKFHPNDLGNLLLRFREQGFTRVSNIFEADSVDRYREELVNRVRETGNSWAPYEIPNDDPITMEPARSPRLLTALTEAFSFDGFDCGVTLFHPAILVKPSDPDDMASISILMLSPPRKVAPSPYSFCIDFMAFMIALFFSLAVFPSVCVINLISFFFLAIVLLLLTCFNYGSIVDIEPYISICLFSAASIAIFLRICLSLIGLRSGYPRL